MFKLRSTFTSWELPRSPTYDPADALLHVVRLPKTERRAANWGRAATRAGRACSGTSGARELRGELRGAPSVHRTGRPTPATPPERFRSSGQLRLFGTGGANSLAQVLPLLAVSNPPSNCSGHWKDCDRLGLCPRAPTISSGSVVRPPWHPPQPSSKRR